MGRCDAGTCRSPARNLGGERRGVAPPEDARGVGRGILQANLLTGKLQTREPESENQDDRGDDGRELRRDAAALWPSLSGLAAAVLAATGLVAAGLVANARGTASLAAAALASDRPAAARAASNR